MRAFYLKGAGRGEYAEGRPTGDCRKIIRVQACGVCGADRKGFVSPPGGMTLPRILGHEIVGALALDLPDKGLEFGDQVVVWPALCCGTCHFCRTGRENLCEQLQLFGYHLDGGFADGIFLGEAEIASLRLLKIPAGLSPEQAAFCEPVACVLNGLRKVNQRPRTCLVLGAGVMGRLAGRLARQAWQAEIFFHDLEPLRLELAGGEGKPSPEGLKADLVFVAASSRLALSFGLKHLAPGGTMVLFSGVEKGAELSLLHNELHQREQCLVGAYGCTPADFSRALALLAARKIEVDDLISRRLSLADLATEFGRSPAVHEFKTIVVI